MDGFPDRNSCLFDRGLNDLLPGNYDRTIEILSDDPKIVRIPKFLSDSECDSVVNLCRPLMKKCDLIGATNRNCDVDTAMIVRNNSWIMWMKHGEENTPVIMSFMERLKAALSLSIAPNNELMQIHKYEVGEECEPHHDFYERSNYSIKRFGQRMATVLFYLNDVEEGGGTLFPRLNISIKPVKGDVIMFRNVRANGEGDTRTLHSGEKVTKGSKWIAIKVINEDIAAVESKKSNHENNNLR